MTSISKNLYKSVSLAVIVCAQLFFTLPVGAQDAVTFTVSPTIFDMTANPGQTWQSTIRIINANPFDLRIFVEVNNFEPRGETGTPKFIPVDGTDAPNSTLAEWIATEREITIPAEKTIELPLTISLPPDAAPGGHFAAVMISTKPTGDASGQTSVQTAQVISSLIFLRVSGDIKESSSIRSFRTTDYILSKPEATFEIRIENKGNVHVQPQGQIKIFNMWGQERGTIAVNQQTLFGNVLPNSVRKYAFTWNSEWSVTDIGRYTAVATLAYGLDGRQSMTADTAFWIIPWKILLTLLVVVGSFVALVTWGIRLYVKHMLRLAGVTPGFVQPSAVEQIAIKTSKKLKRKVSVVAPIEVSILDLRARLSTTHTIQEYARALTAFIKTYKIFFAVAAAVLVFLILVVWFVVGALTPARDFEITVENNGQSVTVTGGEVTENVAAPTSDTPSPRADLPLNITNRSGDDALVNIVKSKLEQKGYRINNVTNDFSSAEKKTVIVFDPSYEAAALELSLLFGGALLSAYETPEGSSPEIMIYLGTEAEDMP